MRCAPLTLALILLTGAQAASLPKRVKRVLDETPAARSAFWGIQVVDLRNGRTLYALNQDKFFVPASNTKLFTTALALTRLGPRFTFETRIMAPAAPDAAGSLKGPLRLIGGGDPNLSGRAIPYRPGSPAGNPLAIVEDLANQVASKGVKRIEGDIVGDDTVYVWQPYPDGWGIEDPVYEYGAAVSALTLNDGALTVRIAPGGREGDPAAIAVNPPVEYYAIDNRIRTVAAGGAPEIHLSRAPGGFELDLWGTIPVGGPGQDFALGIDDPAQYAAQALRQALENRGIAITGNAAAAHRYPEDAEPPPVSGVTLAEHTSAPLIEDLAITDKVSQNLHAELALHAVGRAKRNAGSLAAGLEELKAFLAEAEIEETGYSIHDGSGLSRLNLVTPATVVKLLRYMYAGPLRESWISLLPVGGQDGTLTGRQLSQRIHAKTGSLAHVHALSGYAERRNGSWVAFSILVNNADRPASEVRGIMDRICTLLLD
jgi:D-alanyl-D-alanine carboxypeptidase/D-alanyl-D-alanine-endopeptidase (penicillin-binding protein 4)